MQLKTVQKKRSWLLHRHLEAILIFLFSRAQAGLYSVSAATTGQDCKVYQLFSGYFEWWQLRLQ